MHHHGHWLSKFRSLNSNLNLSFGDVDNTSNYSPKLIIVNSVLCNGENSLGGKVEGGHGVDGLGVELDLVVNLMNKGSAILATSNLSLNPGKSGDSGYINHGDSILCGLFIDDGREHDTSLVVTN